MPEIVKGQRVNAAFQRVLDDPRPKRRWQHPALKPLLERGRGLEPVPRIMGRGRGARS